MDRLALELLLIPGTRSSVTLQGGQEIEDSIEEKVNTDYKQ